jgi:integrase
MVAKLTKTSMPGIFRRHGKNCSGGRCDCSYVVVWRHRGKQEKATCRTYAEARELKGRKDAGDRRPEARDKLGDYFEDWIKNYSGRTAAGFSEASREEYDRVVRKFVLKRWKTWRLAEVEPSDIRGLFLGMREKGNSTSEIKKTRAAISAMFGTAAEDGVLSANPVQGVRIPGASDDGVDDGPSKAMTREELGLILAAIPEADRLFFELLAHTGLRIGEAVGLTWEHLDLGAEKPRLLVREQVRQGKRKRLKSRAGRRDLPLSPYMTSRLLAHRRDTFRGPKAPVFASGGKLRQAGDGNPFPLSPPNHARAVLHPARKAIGLEWITFHSFRHTCASLLFAEGRNIKQVQEWLGHSDPSFTLRTYVHLMDDGIGDAAFFDDVVSVPQGNTGATPCRDSAVPASSERPDKKAV